MTSTPPTVTEAHVTTLQQWFNSAAIVEIAAVIAFENYRARFNVALGIEGHTIYQPDAPEEPEE